MLRDFKCPECGFVAEDVWTKREDDLTAWECPSCELGTMRLLPSAPSFVVKGYSASNGYSKDRS